MEIFSHIHQFSKQSDMTSYLDIHVQVEAGVRFVRLLGTLPMTDNDRIV